MSSSNLPTSTPTARSRARLAGTAGWVGLAGLGLVLGAALARATGTPESGRKLWPPAQALAAGITTEGEGEVPLGDVEVRLAVTASADAPSAVQALDLCAEARDRALATLAAEGDAPGATCVVEPGALRLSSLPGDGARSSRAAGDRSAVRAEQALVLRLAAATEPGGLERRAARLLDVALDAGLAVTLGDPGGALSRVALDRPAVERAACAAALDAARRRASDLAHAAGVGLGPPRAVEVLELTAREDGPPRLAARVRVTFGIE